jgi:hypothetical protein
LLILTTTTKREGRAALVTSFGIIRFICIYSLVEFTAASMLYAVISILPTKKRYYFNIQIILLSEAVHPYD